MRKILAGIVVLCLMSVAGCHRTSAYPPILREVDSLCEVRADSAWALLEGLRAEMETATEAVRKYYQLLTAKAGDKTYHVPASDSLMLAVVRYYEHGGDKTLLPEAYYYMGSTYRDLNDAPRALEYYQKVLETADGHTSLGLLRRTHNQLGWLYYRQWMYDDALSAYIEGYRCDSLLRDSFEMSSDLVNIAYIYRCKEEHNASIKTLLRAREMADALNSQFMRDEADTQIAGLYIELGRYEEARRLIQSPLAHAGRSNLSSVYSIAAKAYLHTGEVDSAAYYYQVLLEKGSLYAQRAAYEGLAEIAFKENQTAQAYEYLSLFKQLTDSVQSITATESVAAMKSMFDYQLREKENQRLLLQQERNKSRNKVIALVAAGVIILLGWTVYGYRKRQLVSDLRIRLLRMHREEQRKETKEYKEENERKIAVLSERIGSLKSEINALERELSVVHGEKEALYNEQSTLVSEKERLIGEKQQMLAELELQKQKLDQMKNLTEIIIKERSESEKAILCSNTYEKVAELVAKNEKLSQGIRLQVEDLLNKVYPHFLSVIRSSNLSPINYNICLLSKMGFRGIDVAKLLLRAKSSITKAKSNIYREITGLEGTAKDFDDYIKSL